MVLHRVELGDVSTNLTGMQCVICSPLSVAIVFRILIEVLSVVTLQIQSITNALKAKVKTFTFEGKKIPLNPNVGVFITMNPGYAGRTELPDNLKALFRPVAMMVPDSQLIAEVFLQSAGFSESRVFAQKVCTLYELMIQQFSKQVRNFYKTKVF